jgi:hypothetical protein
MMLQPGLEPEDCPNHETCGSASELTPEEEVELVRVRQQEQERIQERFRISRQRTAVAMLMQRGCPQSLEDFGIADSLALIETWCEELRSHLDQFTQGCYIAPDNCEVHCYNVKRPSGTYWYNKLTSKDAIFEPEQLEQKVKVIHLSHDSDPRNIEGRLGIERRNRLHQVQTQLQALERVLEQAIAFVDGSL